MNVLMFTNTYQPIVGGVSESVQRLKRQLCMAGHRVLVVAPRLEGQPENETDVVRVAAVQHFNGSDFSLPVPMPGQLYEAIEDFEPDIVHSHHPFLLGDTAARAAETYGLPLVFTHHTLYEHYTHYVPGDSPRMQRFAIALATQYSWLCDSVIAPSESIRDLLLEREANSAIRVVPSGVDTNRFALGNGEDCRRRMGIPEDAYVIGHLGRLAREKNLPFLAEAVSLALSRRPEAHFLVVGDGDAAQVMREIAEEQGVAERFHFTGRLQGRALIDAYHAMDVFAFASHSETQGMVVAEAMAAGLPVVAVAAPGVVEVVVDGENGRLLPEDDTEGLACALEALAEARCREPLRQGALETAANYDERRCAERCLSVYRDVIARGGPFTHADDGGWDRVRGRLGAEWQMLCYRGRLLRHLVQGEWEQERPSWWPGGRQDEPSVPSE
ncbi:glycosyltransferase [Halomonas caseinilytica]|uniref:Glycosyltransferase involved in cell wall bisynthesis n=1 Tax=Halomonas caseinilytica TaxID=438744 RepID=A0A1M6UXU0_9GAMM|nr:glycosyltransferase [Halomonas caseinilytica]SEN36830.1 Glycosyltransferase involved in cell wall bisynthesis [Halomonas caseinilytica]SHK73974.1 Glycosyltransferase involved in cell wall bisynthesis [Halomonas caseinilytica]